MLSTPPVFVDPKLPCQVPLLSASSGVSRSESGIPNYYTRRLLSQESGRVFSHRRGVNGD